MKEENKTIEKDKIPISCFPFISPDGLFEEEEENDDKK